MPFLGVLALSDRYAAGLRSPAPGRVDCFRLVDWRRVGVLWVNVGLLCEPELLQTLVALAIKWAGTRAGPAQRLGRPSAWAGPYGWRPLIYASFAFPWANSFYYFYSRHTTTTEVRSDEHWARPFRLTVLLTPAACPAVPVGLTTVHRSSSFKISYGRALGVGKALGRNLVSS